MLYSYFIHRHRGKEPELVSYLKSQNLIRTGAPRGVPDFISGMSTAHMCFFFSQGKENAMKTESTTLPVTSIMGYIQLSY